MPTSQATHQAFNKHEVDFEFDTVAAGAVSTATGGVRADGCAVVKTGVGTYTVTVTNIPHVEVISRSVQLNQAAGTAFWAGITGIVVTNGSTVISITTYDDNATPAAANLGANGVISGRVVLRRNRITVP